MKHLLSYITIFFYKLGEQNTFPPHYHLTPLFKGRRLRFLHRFAAKFYRLRVPFDASEGGELWLGLAMLGALKI